MNTIVVYKLFKKRPTEMSDPYYRDWPGIPVGLSVPGYVVGLDWIGTFGRVESRNNSDETA